MKEKDLPDNIEDAIILSFLYAEFFIRKILCIIYWSLLKLSWWNFNRKNKMRAIKKFKKVMFTIHEIVWWTVSEIEDWLYPYNDRLTPEERFEVRVKDPISGENWMVEEYIKEQNQRIERLQDEMIYVKDRIIYLENKVKTKVQIKKESPSVSGSVRNTT